MQCCFSTHKAPSGPSTTTHDVQQSMDAAAEKIAQAISTFYETYKAYDVCSIIITGLPFFSRGEDFGSAEETALLAERIRSAVQKAGFACRLKPSADDPARWGLIMKKLDHQHVNVDAKAEQLAQTLLEKVKRELSQDAHDPLRLRLFTSAHWPPIEDLGPYVKDCDGVNLAHEQEWLSQHISEKSTHFYMTASTAIQSGCLRFMRATAERLQEKITQELGLSDCTVLFGWDCKRLSGPCLDLLPHIKNPDAVVSYLDTIGSGFAIASNSELKGKDGKLAVHDGMSWIREWNQKGGSTSTFSCCC